MLQRGSPGAAPMTSARDAPKSAPRRPRLPPRLLVGGAPSPSHMPPVSGGARHSRDEIIRCLRPMARSPTSLIQLPVALLVRGDAT